MIGSIEGFEDCVAVVRQVAKGIGAKYAHKAQMGEEDMESECWMWILEHPQQVARFRSEDFFEKLLAKSLRNHCVKMGESQKAAQHGYSYGDRVEDAKLAAKDVLSQIFDGDVIAAVDAGDGAPKGPWRGGAYSPTVLRRAFLALGESDRGVIEGFYRDGRSNRGMAEQLDVSQQYMSDRHDKAVKRLVEEAGGVNDLEPLDDPRFEGWIGRRSVAATHGREIALNDYAQGFDA